MFTAKSRHLLLQRLFWNPVGASIVQALVRYERKFDIVVRNYSLLGFSNGEQWLLSLLDEKPLVMDVGFHDGASTEEVLRLRSGAQVIGFDPSRFALENYKLRFGGDNRVSFESGGLSGAPGELNFHDYENQCSSLTPRKDSPGQIPTIYKVPIMTLDGYCAKRGIDRINLLKIDVEGFDLNVLEGARDLLARQGVDLFVFEFGGAWAAQKRYLWEADEYVRQFPYGLFRLFNGFLCPMHYDPKMDSCCTLSAMYVGVSNQRMARGDVPLRHYRF
jgi:FkbM family methyltransferase